MSMRAGAKVDGMGKVERRLSWGGDKQSLTNLGITYEAGYGCLGVCGYIELDIQWLLLRLHDSYS